MERLSGRLGNLCLLEKNLNRDLGNRDYKEKTEVYKRSTFKETAAIAENYSQWNGNAINSRQAKMGKCAKSIWKIDF